MKENNTKRWPLCNVPKTRRNWIWTGIGVLLAAAVFFLFVYDLDARVCSADVNRENGQIAFVVPEEQKLYVFHEDGTPAWEYTFSPEQTGGGVADVFYEGGQVAVHPAREETVLLFNDAGELVKTRPAVKSDGADDFAGWKKNGGAYTLTRDGRTYTYFYSYWLTRFGGKHRRVTLTDPAGQTHLLWSASREKADQGKEQPTTEAAPRLHQASDFEWIILGETTSAQLYQRLGAADAAYATGYGTMLKYSLEDGSHLYVRCYGPDMIAKSIEIEDESNPGG